MSEESTNAADVRVGEPVVRIEGLRKSFGDNVVLRGIDLEVQRGEVVVILGPSGSGKSTLLRCVNLLETPTDGRIFFEDTEITAKKTDINKVRAKVGMVFQNFNLFPHLTAKKNVMLAQQKVLHRGKEEAEKIAVEQLTRVGLADRVDYKPSELSGGQQQRVAIARALATNPKIILCDEATSALDPTTTTSILNLLREINRKMGITIVIITHEMSVVESTCTHVAIIDDGRLAECGTVESVFSQPKSAAAKKLIFRTTGADSGAMGERMIRIVFEGSSADEPTISDLAMQCHVAVNIRYADTREVSGKLFGQMILQLPEDHLQQEKAIYFLQNKGLRVEEVTDRVHG